MQQPATISGAQVIVVAQAASLDTQNRYRNMSSETSEKFHMIGKAHITIGAFCIIFQIVSIGIASDSWGHGLWTGSLVRTSAYMSQNVIVPTCKYWNTVLFLTHSLNPTIAYITKAAKCQNNLCRWQPSVYVVVSCRYTLAKVVRPLYGDDQASDLRNCE